MASTVQDKIVLVTGANRGIGYAIVQALSTRFPNNTYILAVRSLSNGHDAIKGLEKLNTGSKYDTVELDVTSDASITLAANTIQSKYNHLDILINNAGIAKLVSPGDPDFRATMNSILDTNVTSVLQTTAVFLPLLKLSPDPRVINVSSTRGSISASLSGKYPPAVSLPYCTSKTALSMAVIEFAKVNPEILFQNVCPGHCKTAFNGYRGARDPLDGAGVVVELVGAEKGVYGMGFWEEEGGVVKSVPW